MQILSFQFHLAPFYKANNADSIEIQRQFFFFQGARRKFERANFKALFYVSLDSNWSVLFLIPCWFFFQLSKFVSKISCRMQSVLEHTNRCSLLVFIWKEKKKYFEGQIEKLCDRCLNVFLLFFYSRYWTTI